MQSRNFRNYTTSCEFVKRISGSHFIKFLQWIHFSVMPWSLLWALVKCTQLDQIICKTCSHSLEIKGSGWKLFTLYLVHKGLRKLPTSAARDLSGCGLDGPSSGHKWVGARTQPLTVFYYMVAGGKWTLQILPHGHGTGRQLLPKPRMAKWHWSPPCLCAGPNGFTGWIWLQTVGCRLLT